MAVRELEVVVMKKSVFKERSDVMLKKRD